MSFSVKYVALVVAVCLGTACSPSGVDAAQSPVAAKVDDIASNWLVNRSESSISFTGSMGGDAFTGAFDGFDARILFDPENVAEAHIDVVIDMAGAAADDGEINDALPGKEWFGVKLFPRARFKSSTVTKTGENQYAAAGELTIKDVTRPFTLPFTLEINDGVAKANAQTSIKRTDFNVGTGTWNGEDTVAHKVDIAIVITANRTK